MNDLRCIAVVYQGKEVSSTALSNFIAMMANNGYIVTGTQPYCVQATMDELIGNAITPIVPQIVKTGGNPYTTEENAIIYIATLFEDSLKTNDDSSFAADFCIKYTHAKLTGSDETLLKCVDIISNTHPLRIRNSIMHKYNVSKKTLKTICDVGNHVLNC